MDVCIAKNGPKFVTSRAFTGILLVQNCAKIFLADNLAHQIIYPLPLLWWPYPPKPPDRAYVTIPCSMGVGIAI